MVTIRKGTAYTLLAGRNLKIAPSDYYSALARDFTRGRLRTRPTAASAALLFPAALALVLLLVDARNVRVDRRPVLAHLPGSHLNKPKG